jgi:hypothetical protein
LLLIQERSRLIQVRVKLNARISQSQEACAGRTFMKGLPAQALYSACGFVPFGEEPLAVAVGEGFATKVHMGCDLPP